MQRTSLYWAIQWTGWISVSVVLIALQIALGVRYEQLRQFVGWPIFALAGIGLSHAARAYFRQRNWLQLPLRRLGAHVLAATLVAGALLAAAIVAGIMLSTGKPVALAGVVGSWMNATILMLGWIIIYLGAGHYRSAEQSRLEAVQTRLEAKQAQLAALESQVNPHFLFNSLNSLRALISENPGRATDMVTQLAELLRYSLQSGRRETVTLAEELTVVRHYLAIEKTRFEDRLQVEITSGPAAERESLPPMLLQTLVENAIKHGIAQRQHGGVVSVDARLIAGRLRVDVTNTGQLQTNEGGLGLKNARERLRLLYGDKAQLTLSETPPDRVLARLEFL